MRTIAEQWPNVEQCADGQDARASGGSGAPDGDTLGEPKPAQVISEKYSLHNTSNGTA